MSSLPRSPGGDLSYLFVQLKQRPVRAEASEDRCEGEAVFNSNAGAAHTRTCAGARQDVPELAPLLSIKKRDKLQKGFIRPHNNFCKPRALSPRRRSAEEGPLAVVGLWPRLRTDARWTIHKRADKSSQSNGRTVDSTKTGTISERLSFQLLCLYDGPSLPFVRVSRSLDLYLGGRPWCQ